MANSSAKRIVAQNSRKIKVLLAVIIIAHAIFLGLTVLKPILEARSIEASRAAAAAAANGDTDDGTEEYVEAVEAELPKVLFLDEDVPRKTKMAYISNSLSILFCFWRLYSMSRPVYSATNPVDIQDPGVDLSIPGALHQYYFDIIYISIFVMITTVLFSSKFWYAHVLTAIFAVYKVWVSFVKPIISLIRAGTGAGADADADDGSVNRGNGKRPRGDRRGKDDKENEGLNRAQRRQKMKEERKKKN